MQFWPCVPPPLTISPIIEGQLWSPKTLILKIFCVHLHAFHLIFLQAMTLKIQDLHNIDQKLHAIDQHFPNFFHLFFFTNPKHTKKTRLKVVIITFWSFWRTSLSAAGVRGAGPSRPRRPEAGGQDGSASFATKCTFYFFPIAQKARTAPSASRQRGWTFYQIRACVREMNPANAQHFIIRDELHFKNFSKFQKPNV